MRGLFILAIIPIQLHSQALIDTSLLLTSRKYNKDYTIFYSDFEKKHILKQKDKHEKRRFIFTKKNWIYRKNKVNSKKYNLIN